MLSKIACVAIVKNEARHIAEWLAWQFLLGFDTVMLLDNGSTDATLEIAAAFTPAHDVRCFHWNDSARGFQVRAYTAAARQLAGSFTWAAFFDADEFLVLDAGLSLKSLLMARPEAAIGVPWAMFGSAGHRDFPPGLLVESFTQRAAVEFPPNKHIKSIIRPDLMRSAISAHAFDMQGGYADLFGNPLIWEFPGYLAAPPAYHGARLHHYFTRSWAHWQEKLARGNPDVARPEAEFHDYDRNEITDTSAAAQAPAVKALLASVANPPPPSAKSKIAAVLVVKDERHDMPAWLAWYQVLGFDSFVIYDDNSTDGTWEFLQSVSTRLDIRLHRTKGMAGPDHQPRQSQCYQDAIRDYRREFAWMAFFDADEFLLLPQDANIQTFLARFPQATQVCVNWCNYGSSRHYLKPREPAFEAYTWHSRASHPINRHVKSIIRPEAVGPAWHCVHFFDVPRGQSVLANGASFDWDEANGFTPGDPDWSVAKLMHYQCRSMEHFIERLKKRTVIRQDPGLWEAYDFKDEQDLRPLQSAPAVRAAMARLTGTVVNEGGVIFDIGMSEGNDTAYYLAKGFKVAGVEADAEIFYRLQERFAAEIARGDLTLYNLAAAGSYGNIVEFYHHNQAQGISGMARHRPEFQPGSYRSYHVMTIDWDTLVAKHGVPYYVKIDIEGQETAFLSGLHGRGGRPATMSVECYQFEQVQALYDLGYRKFQLVDQSPPGGLQLPAVQREGKTLENWTFTHASGPFGLDLPGRWVDFPTVTAQWREAAARFDRTWFDCHVSL